jgi:hypothetical protein
MSWALEDYGPVQSYTQSPFHTNSLSPQIRSGFSLEADRKEIYLNGTISSIWAVTDTYELDYYQNQIAAGLKWQANSNWQLELNYRWNYAGNNHLDRLTIAFHDLFGIDQNGRKEVDNDRFVIDMPNYGIEERDFRGKSLSHALIGYLQYQILTNDHHGLSAGASLYYNNTDHGIFSSNDFEQALQLNYGYKREKHAFDALAALTFRHSPSVFEQIPYRSSTWTFGASYRYRWLDNHFLIGQFAIHQGVTDDQEEFSKPSSEFTFGYRYQMESSAVEITAIENMFNADNSTDIAFGLSYRYRFGGEEG